MPNTITNLADSYPYKREVTKTDPAKAMVAEKEDKASVSEKHNVDKTELINKIENLPQILQRNLEFRIDDDTGQQVVRVIDSETGDLVRQIPPDQILHVISQVQEALDDFLPGVLLDDRV